jgi:diketogulonate reductase-like aldo/keto reductase
MLPMSRPLYSRRRFLKLTAAAGASLATPFPELLQAAAAPLTKPIPSTGEALPVIGMGTWITFNVGNDPRALGTRTDILRAFFAAGGGMIDSSPMYGSAEAVLGKALAGLDYPDGLFSATKVWTRSATDGPAEIAESQALWGLPRMDLLQVHNLLSWRGHLETLQAMKADGRLRYLGVTTSHGRRHAELEQILSSQPIDFVQLTYNIADRDAEQRLLPVAEERGIAVIANRPFRRGALVQLAERHPLPGWAAEIGCDNWPQVLLKFIVSHPAVTCAIPATSQVEHMRENMAAAVGPLPDAELRRRMAADFAAL